MIRRLQSTKIALLMIVTHAIAASVVISVGAAVASGTADVNAPTQVIVLVVLVSAFLTCWLAWGVAIYELIRKRPEEADNLRLYSEFCGRPIVHVAIGESRVTIRALTYAGIQEEDIPIEDVVAFDAVPHGLAKAVEIRVQHEGECVTRTLFTRRPSKVIDALHRAAEARQSGDDTRITNDVEPRRLGRDPAEENRPEA